MCFIWNLDRNINLRTLCRYSLLFHTIFLSKGARYSSASSSGPRSLRNSSVVLQGSIEDFYLTVKLSHHLQTGVLAGQRRSFPVSFKVERRKSISSFKNNSVQRRKETVIQWDILIIVYCVCYSIRQQEQRFLCHALSRRHFFPNGK